MNAIELLAAAAGEVPLLAGLQWEIDRQIAKSRAYRPGTVSDALPLFHLLHEAGWKRTGHPFHGDAWILEAELERNGATLQVEGLTFEPSASGNRAVPYFAPAPPPLRRGKKALAEYREWEDKCLAGAW